MFLNRQYLASSVFLFSLGVLFPATSFASKRFPPITAVEATSVSTAVLEGTVVSYVYRNVDLNPTEFGKEYLPSVPMTIGFNLEIVVAVNEIIYLKSGERDIRPRELIRVNSALDEAQLNQSIGTKKTFFVKFHRVDRFERSIETYIPTIPEYQNISVQEARAAAIDVLKKTK